MANEEDDFALMLTNVAQVMNGHYRGWFRVCYRPQFDDRAPDYKFYFSTEAEARLWMNDMQELVSEVYSIRDNGNGNYEDWLVRVYALREIWSSPYIPADICVMTNALEDLLNRRITDWTVERAARSN